MAKDSTIEWTHHTFNPWWGCAKVSPACEHCYAETWAKRVGQKVWGKNSSRRFFAEKHWKEPLKWNEAALEEGQRARVFCASMSDVFERRADLNPWREKLWGLIETTPMLDWLLLTKRPQNISSMAPWKDDWPENVWLGTTVENQRFASSRLPHLLKHKASVRFLSCEPLLGPIDLSDWLKPSNEFYGIDWVIAGGESGPQARPMLSSWVRNLKDQTLDADAAFHFKQWGHWVPAELYGPSTRKSIELKGEKLIAVGKKEGGRKLDGTTWDGIPMAHSL